MGENIQSKIKNGFAVDNFEKVVYKKFFDVVTESLCWGCESNNERSFANYIDGAKDMTEAVLSIIENEEDD